MKSKADKSNGEKQRKTTKAAALQKSAGKDNLHMADNREVSAFQSDLQMVIDHSPGQTVQHEKLERSFDTPVQRQRPEIEEELMQSKIVQRQGPEEEEEELQPKPANGVQRQGGPEEEELLQGKFASRAEPNPLEPEPGQQANRTGMPDHLKAGIEALSGLDLADVRVHYGDIHK